MANDSAIAPELLDQLLVNYSKPEDLLGEEGLFKQLKKALIERALGAELTEHLGYEKGDPAGRGSGNNRNGVSSKTVLTEDGEIEIAVPRDRGGSFEPQLIPKGQTRFEGFDDKILSLYARGMTVREIQGHLTEIYAIDVSPDLISRVTDAVLDEVREWQSRPLDPNLSDRFLRRLTGQNPRRGACQEQGRLCRARLQCQWRERGARPLDRADRGRQILAEGRQRAQDQRRQRHSDRGRRRLKRLSRSNHDGIPSDPGSDLHCSSDQEQPGLCQLERSQGDHAVAEGDLPRRSRRYCADPARGIRGAMEQALSGNRPDLATGLGACDPIFWLRPEHQKNDLHDKLR